MMAGELIFSGLTGTGFDGGAIVDQIMQVKSLPLQRLQREKALVEAKLSSFANISGAVGDFYSLFESLSISELFSGKRVSVSDESVLSARATDSAPNIEFSITVNKLARAEIRVSTGGFTSLSDTFSESGVLDITYNLGGGTLETFSVEYSAGETLEDLVDRINSSQNRVSASVYYDGTSYRLMLSEKDVGASSVETDESGGVYAIEVSGLPTELGTGMDTLQGAQNAELVIGTGSPTTSPSNTFENIISGITVEVKKTGSATVSVDESYSKVREFFATFVERYNATVDVVKGATFGEEAILRGDYTVSRIETDIANRLDPLLRVGLIDYDGESGRISLRTERLTELLEEDSQAVREVIEELRASYSPYLESQRDFFKGFEDNLSESVRRIEERIDQLAQRLLVEEQLLRREYARLEAFISRANDIRERLKQFMVSVREVRNE